MQFDEDNKFQFTDTPASSPLIRWEGKGCRGSSEHRRHNQRCQIKMLFKLQEKLRLRSKEKQLMDKRFTTKKTFVKMFSETPQKLNGTVGCLLCFSRKDNLTKG